MELLDPPSLPADRLIREYAPWSVLVAALLGLAMGALAGLLTVWVLAWWPRRAALA